MTRDDAIKQGSSSFTAPLASAGLEEEESQGAFVLHRRFC